MKIHLFDEERKYATYRAGDFVYREGDKGELMFAVIEGAVDLMIHGKLVETVESGGVLGEMALVEEHPRITTARARTDSKLVPIDRRRFLFFVQQNPYFSLQLMTVMAARLRRMNERP